MALSGRTLVCAIFGDPIEHSLSPAMHNAAYEALGLDRVYAAFHVRPRDLRDAVRAIGAMGLLGVNLTLPHKERALRMMDSLSGEARTLGAINCVANRRGLLYGDNADARGLETDLRRLGVAIARRPVMIVGAGGAAAAAVLAAIRLGARRVVIANRTRSRAMRLARRFAGRAGRIITASGLDALTNRAALSDLALIINATSIGLGGERFPELTYEDTPKDCFFYDMMYGARPTEFLDRAGRADRAVADGAGMLLSQALLAFKLFNAVDAPAGVMRRALWEKLGRRDGDGPALAL